MAGVELATPVGCSLHLGREIDLDVDKHLAELRVGERQARNVLPGPNDMRALDTIIDAAVASHNATRGGSMRPFSLTGFRGFDDGRFRSPGNALPSRHPGTGPDSRG